MLKILKGVFFFFKKGIIKNQNNENILYILKFFLLLIFVKFFCIMIIVFFTVFFDFEIIKKVNQMEKSFILGSRLLTVSLVAPIFEEILFRLPLRYSRLNISLALSIFVFVMLSLVLNVTYYSSNYIILKLIISFFVFISLYIFLNKNDQLLNIWWNKNQLLIIHSTIILFSFAHSFNFKLNLLPSIFILPIIILPQYFSGLFYSYIRLKKGIFYSIVLHISMNSLLYLKQLY